MQSVQEASQVHIWAVHRQMINMIQNLHIFAKYWKNSSNLLIVAKLLSLSNAGSYKFKIIESIQISNLNHKWKTKFYQTTQTLTLMLRLPYL